MKKKQKGTKGYKKNYWNEDLDGLTFAAFSMFFLGKARQYSEVGEANDQR